MESHHPRYTPLAKVPDTAILEAGLKRFQESEEGAAAWLQPEADGSAVSLERPA
jgi:ectoine hydroxylase